MKTEHARAARTTTCWAPGVVRSSGSALVVAALFASPAHAESPSLDASATSEGGIPVQGRTGELDESPAMSSEPVSGLPETGWQWGLKLGIELPLGKADGGLTLLGREARSGDLSGIGDFRVPIAFDLGYRTSPDWWIGLEAGAGLGPAGDDCTDDVVQCEWSSLRLGAQAMYFFDGSDEASAWMGAVIGWEWLRGTVTQVITVPGMGSGPDSMAPIRVEEKLGGPHLALEGGLPFSLTDHLTLGPFLAGAVGMFLTDEITCPDGLSCPGDRGVDDKQVHAWLALGVRGSHGP